MCHKRHTKKMKTKAIAFDLDDTLLNTTDLLVPRASQQAFQLLINNGLQLNLQQCEDLRLKMIKQISHKDLFIYLAKNYGTTETLDYADKASRLFYEPTLPDDLHLVSGAEDVLNYCKTKYNLYLVTAGYESAQLAKINKLNIRDHFKKIFVVNSLQNERKLNSFKDILNFEKIEPKQLLCIGNSLSSEIKDAKELQAQTCYFEFGEDRGNSPLNPLYTPDYHIKSMDEFIKTCRL